MMIIMIIIVIVFNNSKPTYHELFRRGQGRLLRLPPPLRRGDAIDDSILHNKILS